MKLTSMISSLALVTALTFSGGAFAQAMIGDVVIPDSNLTQFQEKCSAIASAATESLASPEDDPTETGSVEAETTNADPASEDNLDQLLASITVDQCKEAGLLPGGAATTTQ